MLERDFAAIVSRARKRVAKMDTVERGAGFATPADIGPLAELRTVLFALEAGIRGQEWKCVSEAYIMLGDVINKIP